MQKNLKNCLEIFDENHEMIRISTSQLKEILNIYIDNVEKFKMYYLKESDIEKYIWNILTSCRFSVYAAKMQLGYEIKYKEYIHKCIEENNPIHIILAGFPGKCANRNKVSEVYPDMGEFAVLARLEQLNHLIKMRYEPGIRITFMSDYAGLKCTFFPVDSEIVLYVEKLKEWIQFCGVPINIIYITEIFPESDIIEKTFQKNKRNELDSYKNSVLIKSITDNINMEMARKYYNHNIKVGLRDEDILILAAMYYEYFWKKFAEADAVHRYFGDVVYASPVAYHPEKRLCLRLQSAKARIAPWNGVGVIKEKEIYSIDQRICRLKKYKEVRDESGYLWGYLGED